MESTARPGVETGEVAARGRACLSGLRILVVDDDAALRRAVGRLLAGEGARVSEASDGREALDRVRQGTRFDVALVDIEMPHMRGTELARVLRAEANGCRVDTLVGMSGSGRLSDVERSLFNEFLSKPLSPSDLLSLLRSYGE